MLIRLASCRRSGSLAETAATVKEYGRRHIALAGEILARAAAVE
jgi:PTS system mannose-specific IIA component